MVIHHRLTFSDMQIVPWNILPMKNNRAVQLSNAISCVWPESSKTCTALARIKTLLVEQEEVRMEDVRDISEHQLGLFNIKILQYQVLICVFVYQSDKIILYNWNWTNRWRNAFMAQSDPFGVQRSRPRVPFWRRRKSDICLQFSGGVVGSVAGGVIGRLGSVRRMDRSRYIIGSGYKKTPRICIVSII